MVLIQNPKGGGLNGGIGSAASSVIGVQSAGDVMEKQLGKCYYFVSTMRNHGFFVVPKVNDKGQVKTLTEDAAK